MSTPFSTYRKLFLYNFSLFIAYYITLIPKLRYILHDLVYFENFENLSPTRKPPVHGEIAERIGGGAVLVGG
jgi:hypothetical protein